MTYQESHPWLTFEVDIAKAPPELWIMLGECQSKCEHISWAPLLPEIQDKVHRLYLAKGSLATAAIEGNTLSEKEVMLQLEGKLKLPPSKEYLALEIKNIVSACNEVLGLMITKGTPDLTPERLRHFNAQILDRLDLDEGVVPGEFRSHSVGVSRYLAPKAEECESLVERLCCWLDSQTFQPREGMAILYAIIKAVLAHLYLVWIHPFGDGNGRTARLVEFEILIASGVPAPAAHLLSDHYNQTRTEYYRQLDKASGSGGDVIPFLLYAIRGLRDGLKGQLEAIRDQQWDVVWRDYIWQHFRDKTSQADVRRRKLVFALSKLSEPVPIAKLVEIDGRLGVAYGDKTGRTIARDVNELVQMKLVTKEKHRVRARKEAIFGFVPVGTDAAETWMRLLGMPKG